MELVDITIQTRRELATYIHEVMVGSSARWARERKHNLGIGRAKAYLLDVHAHDEADSQSGVLDLFRAAVQQADGAVAETQDAGLYMLRIDGESFVLDAGDPRFVVAHTTGHSGRTDKIIKRLVEADPSIDRAWLPSPFLDAVTRRMGRVSRRTIQFDSHTFWTGRARRADDFWEDAEEPESSDEAVPVGKHLFMDLQDRIAATEVIEDLRRIPYFANALAFARVDVSQRLEDDNAYSVARIFNWGKISGVGTSGELHLAMVARLRNSYRSVLERMEAEFAFGVSRPNHTSPRLHGHPLSITFAAPLPNLLLFAKRLFAGRRPFMLWGMPQVRNDTYITVQALDLHVQQLLYCELMPAGMRVYLKDGACANSVVRLYTLYNLLTYCDASAVLWGKGEADGLLQ